MDKPEMKYCAGTVCASVFMNERTVKGKQVKIPSVVLQKRYLQDGKWKSTNSFNVNDLPKAILMMLEAYDELVTTFAGDVEEQPAEEEDVSEGKHITG